MRRAQPERNATLLPQSGPILRIVCRLVLLAALLPPIPPAFADLPYTTTITVEGNEELQKVLRAASQMEALKDRPPPTETALMRRLAEDVERLTQVARAEGYYAARIEPHLDAAHEPALAEIRVTPGPRYKIGQVAINDLSGAPLDIGRRIDPGDIGLPQGAPGRSADILAAEQRILGQLGRRAHPLAKLASRKVVVDHAEHTVSVTFTIDPGPEAAFGPAEIVGLKTIASGYVMNRIQWKRGRPFDIDKVEATRERLVGSELFTSVRVVPGTAVDASGELPVTIELVERKPRTIGGGVSWSSSEGFGVEGFWQHRNLAGGAERLDLSAQVSQTLIGATGALRLPDLLLRDQDVVSSLALEREDTDAFKTHRAQGQVGIEQRLNQHLTGGIGVSVDVEREEERDQKSTFMLLGLPGFVRLDTTDNPLDPSRGTRIAFAVTPYQSVVGEDDLFLKSETNGSAYYAIDKRARFILAGRGRLGTITGAARGELPADIRFYAGGGGSIRGYAFQAVGPLDDHHDPIGGRSVVEAGGEVRVRITETIGVVPFLEAGNVWKEEVPDFTDPLRYGAGLGLRYYSAIGPIRVDVATPLNPRNSDDRVQFYISLGQAF